jgi:hypothetical protein
MAFIGLDDGPSRYQAVEEVIEAADAREAAGMVIQLAHIHPDDLFPEILVIPEDQVAIFTRDDCGNAATFEEDFPRLMAKGPKTVVVRFDPDDLERLRDQM